MAVAEFIHIGGCGQDTLLGYNVFFNAVILEREVSECDLSTVTGLDPQLQVFRQFTGIKFFVDCIRFAELKRFVFDSFVL